MACQRQAGAIPDTLLLLEHDPVYTKGRRTERADLPMGDDWYRAQGIDVVPTSRGGRVTYHGPGQLVGYPIVGVSDVVAYLRLIQNPSDGVTLRRVINVPPRKIGATTLQVLRRWAEGLRGAMRGAMRGPAFWGDRW